MPLSRRHFLILGALTLAGCSRVIDEITAPDLPDHLNPPGGTTRHPVAHLLNRAAYGWRPGQIEAVARDGWENWLEAQLDYRDIDDSDMDLRLRRFDTLSMSAPDVYSFARDDAYVHDELVLAMLLRAVYSERQLYEVMVGFWSDHFSLFHLKEEVSMLKTVDDHFVIRPHALSHFGDLLRASAKSPAMLRYLDNTQNERSAPNENYAREIMELHTLGVYGGYTEDDIQEVARCFTGWGMTDRGEFVFREEWHDNGEKTVLGHTIPAGGGIEDGERVLDILLAHPSTATYVSSKLARRFISDDPPAEVIEACAATWRETDGDIRDVLRTLFHHPAFWDAPPKYKRPFELMVSLLRATNARVDDNPALLTRLERMAHRPFRWPTPDGYPDTAVDWSGSLQGRWNLTLDAFKGDLPGVSIDVLDLAERGGVHEDAGESLRFFGRLLLGRDMDERTYTIIENYARQQFGGLPDLDDFGGLLGRRERRESAWGEMRELLGLLAAGDSFQWR